MFVRACACVRVPILLVWILVSHVWAKMSVSLQSGKIKLVKILEQLLLKCDRIFVKSPYEYA